VNCCGDDREVGFLYQRVQSLHEAIPLFAALEKDEGRLLLSNIVLVQHDDVMAEMSELESLHPRNHGTCVVVLPEDAEVEHEDRIILVDRGQAMIPALIDVDDIVTPIHGKSLSPAEQEAEIRAR
jgi:hypothetical protein